MRIVRPKGKVTTDVIPKIKTKTNILHDDLLESDHHVALNNVSNMSGGIFDKLENDDTLWIDLGIQNASKERQLQRH